MASLLGDIAGIVEQHRNARAIVSQEKRLSQGELLGTDNGDPLPHRFIRVTDRTKTDQSSGDCLLQAGNAGASMRSTQPATMFAP